MRTIGFAFLLCLMPAGLSGKTEVRPSDSWDELLHLLQFRTIDSSLHRSLLKKYGVPDPPPGGFKEGSAFTQRRFPVALSDREEWPSILAGSGVLFEDDFYRRVLELCGKSRTMDPASKGLPARVRFQGELWAVFDTLYLEGIHPLDGRYVPRHRWKRLLHELALTMKHAALEDSEVDRLETGEELRKSYFRSGRPDDPGAVEFCTIDLPSIHDIAHNFRRINRFFYSDPTRDFARLSKGDLEALSERNLPLGRGARAMIEEDAILITKDGSLRETELPVLFKTYDVVSGEKGTNVAQFSMSWVDDRAPSLSPKGLIASTPETESWAEIDLPAMPGKSNRLPLRAPLAFACAGCHGTFPQAFRPGRLERDPADYRFAEATRGFVAHRNLQFKELSAEYVALRQYFVSEIPLEEPLAGIATLEGGEKDAPASNRSFVGGLIWGGLVGLVLGLRLARRPRSEAGPADPTAKSSSSTS